MVMNQQGSTWSGFDFSAYDLTDDRLKELLKNEAKVILNRGLDFGEEGTLHARLNGYAEVILGRYLPTHQTIFATL